MTEHIPSNLAEFVGQHPRLVPVAICTVLILMMIRSMIRAFQRWEILPDPLFPAKVRKVWDATQKAGEDQLLRTLTGKKNRE